MIITTMVAAKAATPDDDGEDDQRPSTSNISNRKQKHPVARRSHGESEISFVTTRPSDQWAIQDDGGGSSVIKRSGRGGRAEVVDNDSVRAAESVEVGRWRSLRMASLPADDRPKPPLLSIKHQYQQRSSPRDGQPAIPLPLLLLLLLLLPILLMLILQIEASTLTDFDGATFYKAPVGSRIRIACNGSHWSEDSVSLVLWFKGTIERHSMPIYTVDARQKPLNNGARHLVSDNYKGRARFVTRAQPPYLDLGPLEADDQSEYRCRIDYRSKPRENFLIILFVLVPPRSVQIIDSGGRSLEQIYGPLSEDSDLTLLCLSKGGRPAPSVTWRRRNRVIDDSYLTINDFLALKQSGQLLANGYLGTTANTSSSSASPGNLDSRDHHYRGGGSDDDVGLSSSSSSSSSAPNKNQSGERTTIQLAIGQLESLWRDWRSWPEFDYFDNQMNGLFGNRENHPFENNIINNNDNSSEAPASGHTQHQQEQRKLSNAGSSVTTTGNAALATPNLLTLEVHDSITTSINVLHLSSLMDLQQQQQRPAADGATGRMSLGGEDADGRPQFECEASNLHYDLRSLIKLFAPPSLSATGAAQPTPHQQTAGPLGIPLSSSGATTTTRLADGTGANFAHPPLPDQEGEPLATKWPQQPAQAQAQAQAQAGDLQVNLTRNSQLGRQLVEAIEIAFEATLRRPYGVSAVAEWPAPVALTGGAGGGGGRHQLQADDNNPSIRPSVQQLQLQQQQRQRHQGTSGADAIATALSQIKTEGVSPPLNSNGSQQQQQLTSLFTLQADPKRQAELANVIYNHLARPHQLSSGSLAMAATEQQQQQQQQTTNSQLRPLPPGHDDHDDGAGAGAGAGGSSLATESPALVDKQQQSSLPVNPLVRSKLIALDVYFRPLDVKIINPQRPLSAGQLAEFGCSSSGSRPPATLNWLKNGQPLDRSLQRQIIEPNGNVSHSKLSIRLEQQDHGAQLTCRAENEQLARLGSATATAKPPNKQHRHGQQKPISSQDSAGTTASEPEEQEPEEQAGGSVLVASSAGHALEESRTLVVHYAPRVKLELGNKMLSTDIREGSDIYFVCHVESQPPSKEITWLHNERLINETSSSSSSPAEAGTGTGSVGSSDGLIISNNSLVLQRVKVEQAGQYACMAFNSEGITESNRLELRVLHAPTCVRPGSQPEEELQQQQQRGRPEDGPVLVARRRLSLKAKAKLLCQVEADPPELEISWYLDNNSESNQMERRRLVAASSSFPPANPSSKLTGATGREFGNNTGNVTTAIQAVAGKSVTGGGSGAPGNTNKRRRTVSQLSYMVDTASDYGRLYCLARNSVGEQKRPCLYEILPPEPEEAPELSCLVANVTSSAAWVACDWPQVDVSPSQGSKVAGGQQDIDQEVQQHELGLSIELYSFSERDPQQANDQNEPLESGTGSLDAEASELSTGSASQTQRNTEYGLNDGDLDESGGGGGGSSSKGGQLEANLSLGPIEEPIFSVNNLRPGTRYGLHIRAIEGPIVSQAAVVRFETASGQQGQATGANPKSQPEAPPAAAQSSAGRRRLEPSAEPILGQHHSGLLSALLISTRSTNLKQRESASKGGEPLLANGRSSGSGRGNPSAPPFYQEHKQRQQQPPVSHLSSSLSNLWATLGSLMDSLKASRWVSGDTSRQTVAAKSPRNGQQQHHHTIGEADNQLMDVSDALLIAGVSLILLASLAAMLLLHRRSKLLGPNGSLHQKPRAGASATGKKMDGSLGGHDEMEQLELDQLDQKQHRKSAEAQADGASGSSLACDEMMMMMQLAAPTADDDDNNRARSDRDPSGAIDLMQLQSQLQQRAPCNKTLASARGSNNNCVSGFSPRKSIDCSSPNVAMVANSTGFYPVASSLGCGRGGGGGGGRSSSSNGSGSGTVSSVSGQGRGSLGVANQSIDGKQSQQSNHASSTIDPAVTHPHFQASSCSLSLLANCAALQRAHHHLAGSHQASLTPSSQQPQTGSLLRGCGRYNPGPAMGPSSCVATLDMSRRPRYGSMSRDIGAPHSLGGSSSNGRSQHPPQVAAPIATVYGQSRGGQELYEATPIRVTKSRSSLCLESLLMSEPVCFELEHQQQQQQLRLIQFSDHIDRRLISDANLKLGGGGSGSSDHPLGQQFAAPSGLGGGGGCAAMQLAPSGGSTHQLQHHQHHQHQYQPANDLMSHLHLDMDLGTSGGQREILFEPAMAYRDHGPSGCSSSPSASIGGAVSGPHRAGQPLSLAAGQQQQQHHHHHHSMQPASGLDSGINESSSAGSGSGEGFGVAAASSSSTSGRANGPTATLNVGQFEMIGAHDEDDNNLPCNDQQQHQHYQRAKRVFSGNQYSQGKQRHQVVASNNDNANSGSSMGPRTRHQNHKPPSVMDQQQQQAALDLLQSSSLISDESSDSNAPFQTWSHLVAAANGEAGQFEENEEQEMHFIEFVPASPSVGLDHLDLDLDHHNHHHGRIHGSSSKVLAGPPACTPQSGCSPMDNRDIYIDNQNSSLHHQHQHQMVQPRGFNCSSLTSSSIGSSSVKDQAISSPLSMTMTNTTPSTNTESTGFSSTGKQVVVAAAAAANDDKSQLDAHNDDSTLRRQHHGDGKPGHRHANTNNGPIISILKNSTNSTKYHQQQNVCQCNGVGANDREPTTINFEERL